MTRYISVAVIAAALLTGCAHQITSLPSPAASIVRAERTFTFTTIEVPGARQTSAQGINDGGDIVGFYVDSADVRRGFLLRRGTFTTIDFPGASFTDARGIGPRGEIVGSYRMPGEPTLSFHGYLLKPNGDFVPVNSPGHVNTIAQRILPDGTILGCRHDNDFNSTMRGAVFGRRASETDAYSSMHNGATPDLRRIVGLYNSASGERADAYVIDDGVFRALAVPSSTMTTAWDVNRAGEVVGFYRDSTGFHGFLLTAAGFVPIDVPNATATRAFGINVSGAVVGAFVAGGRTSAYLATPARAPER